MSGIFPDDVPLSSVVYGYFDAWDKDTAAPSSITGLAVGDVKIYKNASMTQRTSTNGITLLDTDGIDLDGIVGINGFSIDLSDNSDAGFYAAGSNYAVVVDAITVDSVTTSFVAGTFWIEQVGGALALAKAIKVVTDQFVFTVANQVNANTLRIEGTDATDQIRDAILSDATRFAGADITAIKGFIDTEIGTILTNIAAVKAVVDTINTNTDTEVATLVTNIATILAAVDTEVASILTAANAIKVTTDKFVFTVANQVDANALAVGDKTGYTLTADFRIKKNTALAGFPFPMKDVAGALVTGATVTTTRSINAGAFAAATNSAAEITGTGIYKYDFSAADLNGDTICFKFAAPGCVDRYVTVVTQTE
jgi:hypothetical protein